MTKLIDYSAMTQKKFWDLVDTASEQAEKTFKGLWEKAAEGALTQEEACECLNALFIYSHQRIKERSKVLAKYYPTKQLTKNRLGDRENLWWVDHFTAGISKWSTLNWFSAAKHKSKKTGKMRFNGASTHFIQGYHDYPFYIIPLMHGAWHEPRRNKDSVSVETVNAGALHKGGANKQFWFYWARQMPLDLVRELPPVLLDRAYRGVKVMQPFTREQMVNNIILKRIVIAALHGKLEAERMSQHTDWRKGKTDMGPLWQFDECNSAAYDNIPVEELVFIQNYEEYLDEEGAIWDEDSGFMGDDGTRQEHDESANPEYGDDTPTHDDDPDDDDDKVLDISEVQRILVKRGYNIAIDDKMGPKTKAAVKTFQQKWNNRFPKERLAVDGIPGPQTCAALLKK